jgi:hypothetical protein
MCCVMCWADVIINTVFSKDLKGKGRCSFSRPISIGWTGENHEIFVQIACLGLWLKRVLHCASQASCHCIKSAAINVCKGIRYLFIVLFDRTADYVTGTVLLSKQNKADHDSSRSLSCRNTVATSKVKSTQVSRQLRCLLCVLLTNRHKVLWHLEVKFF